MPQLQLGEPKGGGIVARELGYITDGALQVTSDATTPPAEVMACLRLLPSKADFKGSGSANGENIERG